MDASKMKLPNESPLSRIPAPMLIVAWGAAVALTVGCLFWALLTFPGGESQATSNVTPTKVIATPVSTAAQTKVVTVAPKLPTQPPVSPTTSAPATVAPPPTAQPTNPPPGPTTLPINEKFGYGIQVNGFDDPDGSIAMVKKLGMTWIKQQIVWGSLEHEKGNMDWSGLERIVRKANKADLKIMLSFVTAPTWSHPAIGPDPKEDPNGIKAPPDDLNAYADFVAQVVERQKEAGYPVHAVEIWNEQNLSREWRISPQRLDAFRYMEMLKATFQKVKEIDPNIIVISGALSPTGVDDGVSAVDDLKYLQQMVNHGLLDNADCIGVHHNGINLPPDVPYQDAPNHPKAKTATFRGPFDNPHHSWSFNTTLNEYARIVNRQKPLCITEFGWPSSEGIATPVRQGFEFSKDNTLQDQANYIVQAFQLMKQWGFVKIAFLWNLNFNTVTSDPTTTDNAIYSVLTSGGQPRPAFDALGNMPK
jgi:hypothetical protein